MDRQVIVDPREMVTGDHVQPMVAAGVDQPSVDALFANLAGTASIANRAIADRIASLNLQVVASRKVARGTIEEEVPCLDRGIKGRYVTLDQHGCAVYFKDKNGKVREHLVKRVLVDPVIDTTGCGDSFAGGLAYGFLKTQDYVKACQYGNCAGAFRCGSTELDVYGTLENVEAQIEETYGN